MIKTIQRKALAETFPTDRGDLPSVDASDLGLKPGEWPTTIRLIDSESTGRQFATGTQVGSVMDHGELTGVIYYASEWALSFVVVND